MKINNYTTNRAITESMTLDKMLSRDQVADIFGIKPKTVYTWVANGKLSKPDVVSPRYSRFPLSRVREDYFRQFGRELILKTE